jgi:hypothetical protein
MIIRNFFGLFVILSLLVLSSCKKEDTAQDNEFLNASDDLATQQDLLEANETEINEQISFGLMEMETRSFPIRTWANPKGSYPNTLTIDYGTSGVTGPKGKLIIQISNPITIVGATRIVTHEQFFIDDVKIEGTVTLVNQGPNAQNQPVYLRNVVDRKLIFPSGQSCSWNATQILTQLEGFSTPEIKLDDVWSVGGASHGVNRAGKSFSVITTDALIIKALCKWTVKGTLVITVDSKSISIDFGMGNCDNLISITLPDGSQREVRIRRWW